MSLFLEGGGSSAYETRASKRRRLLQLQAGQVRRREEQPEDVGTRTRSRSRGGLDGLLPVEALVGALTVTLDVDRAGGARTGVG